MIVKHSYFTLSYSERDEQAEWVAYKLTKNNFYNRISRTNDYREDSLIPTGSSLLTDYYRSGYDRGHLAPAGSMKINQLSMSESFYMSNMSPQKAEFNRFIWKDLEELIRNWVTTSDSLFVVTGPLLDNPIAYIGTNNVAVPRAFYKTILGYKNSEPKGIAFIIPNERSTKPLSYFAVSIDQVEDITGIDFYYNLDKNFQQNIESTIKFIEW